MRKGILGRKVGMTQIFQPDGSIVPVTVIEAGPCKVLQVKTVDRDGYDAVQLGFLDKPRRLASRSERGHVANISSKRASKLQKAGLALAPKADGEPKKFIKELRGEAGMSVGQDVLANVLDGVKAVDVTGISKGCGYSGWMKRHNFKGQRATHGVKKVHRHPGGTAAGTYPGRVRKGKKMAGHYGVDQVTMRNLKLIKIDVENNLILVHGPVPGPAGGYVVVRETNKVG
ncbi:MAG: 50S ribosomal protein L3 [Planctomycetota bacterium]|jgi:large subunit ribosomal protein L3|nr:50S ribosomal protein L3 [Planctomycetaceae bacterium]